MKICELLILIGSRIQHRQKPAVLIALSMALLLSCRAPTDSIGKHHPDAMPTSTGLGGRWIAYKLNTNLPEWTNVVRTQFLVYERKDITSGDSSDPQLLLAELLIQKAGGPEVLADDTQPVRATPK